MNTNTNMGNTVYWHKNQVMIRLKAQFTHPTSEARPVDPIQIIIRKLQDALLNFGLQFIEPPRALCPLPNSIDSVGNIDFVAYCHINPKAQTNMGSMQGNSGTVAMGDDDLTLDFIINKLDYGKTLQSILQSVEALHHTEISVDVMPHWLKAATDGITQGCPITPPIPAGETSASGWWKLQFSQLSGALQDATGKDITVLVLDTLPAPDQITRAAEQAGSRNMLLQKMTKGMGFEEPFNAVPPAINCTRRFLPDIVEGTPPERVVTGKDIYGRHVGFPMADHGLFIAGIVRDLAPEAHLECIRVLNDFGVGDIRTLHAALNKIYNRMSSRNPDTNNEVGDLYKKLVVINLSLVVLPPEDDIPDGVTDAILKPSQDLLYQLIQCVADQGAIFVASAGNDSDPRMDASEVRFGPRYPAALADRLTAMIPVGAVNKNRQAAMYSNYPGPYGIATYGGDLPKPDPWLPSAMYHIAARVDMTDLDALCGIYSAAQYPALSKNDPESEYYAPNSSTWAYWSGTSFATPIISALAARISQGHDPSSSDVGEAILNVAMDEVMWTRVDDQDIPGPMIMAVQDWQPA